MVTKVVTELVLTREQEDIKSLAEDEQIIFGWSRGIELDLLDFGGFVKVEVHGGEIIDSYTSENEDGTLNGGVTGKFLVEYERHEEYPDQDIPEWMRDILGERAVRKDKKEAMSDIEDGFKHVFTRAGFSKVRAKVISHWGEDMFLDRKFM